MRKLCLDLGSKTCGIAISDENNSSAYGLINFHYQNNNMMLIIHELKKIMQDYENTINEFILGYPYNHLNDNSNQSCERIDKFKNLLNQEFPKIEVIYMDENFSTSKASTLLFESNIKASNRKKVIDMVSAIVILQDYLDSKK